MGKALGWIVFAIFVYYAWNAGWLHSINQYFSESADKARQEQVIYEEDGSITTVKYRSPLQMFLGDK